MEKKFRIGVIGSGANLINKDIENVTLEVGRLVAKNGAILVCGGLGGVMEMAAKGAKKEGGLTIGILPTDNINDANPYIDIPIATGIGEARNIIVVRNSHILIAIRGKYGTLSEIAFALKLGKPVVGLDTWKLSRQDEIDSGIILSTTPKEAVEKALEAVKKSRE